MALPLNLGSMPSCLVTDLPWQQPLFNRGTTSHLQRRDFSSYLIGDQTSSIISANSHMKWETSMTIALYHYNFYPPREWRLLSALTHPSNYPPNDFASHLPHNKRFKHWLEWNKPFPDIALSFIRNFPVSILSSSVNLLRLDISNLSSIDPLEVEIIVQSELMPKNLWIPYFRFLWADDQVVYMLKGKMVDDQLSTSRIFDGSLLVSKIKRNVWYLLQNAKLLEKLHLWYG